MYSCAVQLPAARMISYLSPTPTLYTLYILPIPGQLVSMSVNGANMLIPSACVHDTLTPPSDGHKDLEWGYNSGVPERSQKVLPTSEKAWRLEAPWPQLYCMADSINLSEWRVTSIKSVPYHLTHCKNSVWDGIINNEDKPLQEP